MLTPQISARVLALLLALPALAPSAKAEVPYERWTAGVKKHPAVTLENRHVIHSYYCLDPESPDGKYILYYTSGTPKGEEGDLRILERSTGKETIVAQNIHTEDAHRAACQQWVNGGKTIVYHDYRNGKWVVVAIDLKTLKEKVLAEDRQLGFGSSNDVNVPIYGCHWNPGDHRDLELVNVETGAIQTVVTADSVVEKYGEWTRKRFGDVPLSICFPALSPDGKKVFFKVGHPSGGNDFHSMKASDRDGKVIYDLENKQFLRQAIQWGHPSWTPDSKGILEYGNFVMNAETGKTTRYAKSPSNHPSMAPDGLVFSSDGKESKKEKEWVVVVVNTKADEYTKIDKFDNDRGATSWRRSHPHPVFSADGKRLYYNVNDGPWTRLFVAEAGDGIAR